MSEENKVETQTVETNNVTNNSTEAEKNVPYNRFQEVVQSKNDMAAELGKLQAQIDKMNADNKSKAEAKLVEDGKLKEALGIMTQERDSYKSKADQWSAYQTSKRETLMSKVTNDDDKSIAEGLQDLNKLESFVNRVTKRDVPSTSTARADSGNTGDMGGYSSYAEWATKDPKGYEEANGKVDITGMGGNTNLHG